MSQVIRHDAHTLAQQDPRELVWAAANAASSLINQADILAEAVQCLIDAKDDERQSLIDNFLKNRLAQYRLARQHRNAP